MTDLLTVSQAAEIAGRSNTSIRRALRRGTLQGLKVGSVWIVTGKQFEN